MESETEREALLFYTSYYNSRIQRSDGSDAGDPTVSYGRAVPLPGQAI
jgi:hypothetical protein